MGILLPTDNYFYLLFFYLKNNIIISLPVKKKKKMKNCGRPTGHNFGHSMERNTLLFKCGPGERIFQFFEILIFFF